MADYSTTKYIYRDIQTGRLIHKRQAEARPADSWTREAFEPPTGLEPPFGTRASSTQPVMEVDEDHDDSASATDQAT